jgi:tetratricopeptide (TPR) repeat protein
MVRLLLALLLAALAGPGLAQSNSQQTSSASAANGVTPLSSTEIERLRVELDLKRENAVLQARNELSGEAYTRLEILLAAFGVVLAVAGLVFGLSTREAAIAKAQEGVEAIRREMERLRDETRQAAEAHIERLRAVDSEASIIMDRLRTGEVPEDPHERQTVLDAAKLAEAKPPNERSAEDLRALVTGSLIDRNWEQMRSHASALLYLFSDNEKVAAEASVNLAYALHELGRTEEALQVDRQLLARIGQSTDPDLLRQVCLGTFNCGVYLDALARPEEAIAAYDDIIARFGDSTEPVLSEWIARSLVNKGIILGTLDKPEEAIAAYDDVIARFGDSTEPALYESVARSLVNKGVMLGALDKPEEASAAYDDVVARFGDSTEPALYESVAKSMVNKGVMLGTLDKPEEAIGAFDDVASRFGDCTELVLREQVAKALVNKSVILGTLDKLEEAIDLSDYVVARFGDSTELALCEQVARALVNKGFRLGKLGKSEDALAAYDELLTRFGDSAEPALRAQIALALFNKACERALERDVAATIEALRLWRDYSGRFDCDKIAKDGDFDPVRGDPSFVALLDEMGCAKTRPSGGSKRKSKAAGR